MKKALVALFVSAGIAAAAHAQVTLNFSFGILSDIQGNPVADGSLVQIIASPDATFADPSASAFVSGNDVLIFSGGMDSSQTGVSGGMLVPLNGVTGISQYNLLLRWFPSLSTLASTPGATAYGQYGYPVDVSWVAPANGGNQSFSFLTQTLGGALADSAGQASLSTAPVPEPSTYAAILGVLAVGLVAYRRRQAIA